MKSTVVFAILVSLLAIFASILLIFFEEKTILALCNTEECPFCYGTTMCDDFKENKVILDYTCFRYFFYNVFSVKNIYFANFNKSPVVLKKLGHSKEIKDISELKHPEVNSTLDALLNFILDASSSDSAHKNFKVCDKNTLNLLMDQVEARDWREVWTIFHVNIEPIILDIFKNEEGWPVPKMLGSCGLVIVEQNHGADLNNFEMHPWRDRAHLAVQLLEAAVNFTDNHPSLRIYLTDVSPDNIVVDDQMKVHFVDLENVILMQKQSVGLDDEIHYSRHVLDDENEDNFVYFENEICSSSISDHNVYSICRLLLSVNSPWPMMNNGLLHSPPPEIREHNLFRQIEEECVDSRHTKSNRLQVAKKLITSLKEVIDL